MDIQGSQKDIKPGGGSECGLDERFGVGLLKIMRRLSAAHALLLVLPLLVAACKDSGTSTGNSHVLSPRSRLPAHLQSGSVFRDFFLPVGIREIERPEIFLARLEYSREAELPVRRRLGLHSEEELRKCLLESAPLLFCTLRISSGAHGLLNERREMVLRGEMGQW